MKKCTKCRLDREDFHFSATSTQCRGCVNERSRKRCTRLRQLANKEGRLCGSCGLGAPEVVFGSNVKNPDCLSCTRARGPRMARERRHIYDKVQSIMLKGPSGLDEFKNLPRDWKRIHMEICDLEGAKDALAETRRQQQRPVWG